MTTTEAPVNITDEVTFWTDEPDLWNIQWVVVNRGDGTHTLYQQEGMTLDELTELLGVLGFAPKS
jgi:hypothetical protein